jgi:centromeric protein E
VASELESYVEEREDDVGDSVHVAVRLRPSFGVERDVWTWDPVRGFIGGKLGDFFFGISSGTKVNIDYVYTAEDTNYSVYDASVKKLVKKAMDGYNATVFAYGQTSSGKTHTMRGHAEEAGIIPLAVADLFEEISSVRPPPRG